MIGKEMITCTSEVYSIFNNIKRLKTKKKEKFMKRKRRECATRAQNHKISIIDVFCVGERMFLIDDDAFDVFNVSASYSKTSLKIMFIQTLLSNAK